MDWYTIEKSPSDELSLRNCAVVREGDALAGEKYIRVIKGGSAYSLTLATQKGFSAGALGLSGVQREWCSVRLKEKIQVKPFPIDRSSNLIGGIVVELDFYAKPKTVPPALNTDTLAPLFRERLVNNVFVVGQQIVLGGWDELPQLKKNPLKATILQITPEDISLTGKGTQTSKKVDFGILYQSSRVIFERKKESSIQLTGRAVGDSAHTSIISPDWDFKQMGIGGLDKEFSDIFRRAFASRVFPPDVVEQLGMKHVRGILLFGPPGTGKTLMARQIGKMLHARDPKIINGPEVLNKYVGESEQNIRQLFAEAESEQKKMGINSALHIIIFDELDAICKQRGSVGGGTGVHDTVVNQLLAKIDGVEQLNNILLIGMTNRMDLIDDALLRPGRLEVQMEIGLPDEGGRLEILNIHTSQMRANGKLDPKVDLQYLASKTRNFSGAEIEGLVRSAQATAMNKIIKAKDKVLVGREEAERLKVMMEDFEHALQYDLKPAFGISDEQLDRYVFNGIIPWGPRVQEIGDIGRSAIQQIRTSVRTPLVSLLLRGDSGCGKTALAASLARDSGFPFIKILTPENMIGYSEGAKCQAIKKVFDDAYKSELSCVVVDDIERLFDYVPIGPRFSNLVLQALLVLLRKLPPVTGKVPHKLLVIGTTRFSSRELHDTGLAGAFNTIVDVPTLRQGPEVMAVLKESDLYSFKKNQLESLQKGLGSKSLRVGIKKLLAMIEASLQTEDPVKTLLLRLQLEARLGAKEDNDSFFLQ